MTAPLKRTATEPADEALQDVRAARRENVLVLLGVILLALFPFVDHALGLGTVGSWEAIFVYVILAMGLNIVVGFAGLLDLGYAAFFAIGAYTIGFLTSPSSVFVQAGLVPGFLQRFWPALAISWVVAAMFGVLLGAPTLRLRGDYLAIVTLGFGEIVPNFFRNADSVTGGVRGLNPIAQPPTFTLFGHAIGFGPTDQDHWYWLMLAIGLFSLFLIRRLYNSRLGRTWQAIREDEIAASAMGVNLVSTKLWAFALGASFAGFAGSVFSSAFQYVDPTQFEFSVSVTVLAMVILGGVGNVYGVIAGALLIGAFDRILTNALNAPIQALGDQFNIGLLSAHDLKNDRFLVFGLALVLMMLLRPGGLFPSKQRAAELAPTDPDVTYQEQETYYDVRHEDEAMMGEPL
ncbi:MAG TPA: branched-chain amino acid ABC transporter permease [Thermomicrobiales bacterium]|nr:branched-chain amino acid ABC transporter permease [Thermomicrobiales bacterium]